MTKFYKAALCLMCCIPLLVQGQDTLKRYNIFTGNVQSPLETESSDPYGYRYGHGAKGIYEMAEKYYVAEEHNILGVMVLLDDVSGIAKTTDECWAGVYSSAPTGGPNDDPLFSSKMAIDQLNLGLTSPTIFTFDDEQVKDSFYVSFGFPSYKFNRSSPDYVAPEDALGIYATDSRDGDSDPDAGYKNAVRFSASNSWESTEFILGYKVNFCITPIVQIPEQDTTEDSTSSIARYQVNSNLALNHIYPNPVVDHVNLGFTSEASQRAELSLYNLSGQIIKSESLQLVAGEQNVVVNLDANLPSGSIIALVRTETGNFSFVLNKQ